MTSTPPDQSLSESWVELSHQAPSPIFSATHSPCRITPIPFGGEQDYLRMLREAQRESNRSSSKVSPISSALMSLSSTCRNTPSASPKSPPNSPNPELANLTEEFKDVYINTIKDNGNGHSIESDMVWDWSSQPNLPHKDWKLPPSTHTLSVRKERSRKSSSGSSSSNKGQLQQQQISAQPKTKVDLSDVEKSKRKKSVFSKEVVYTLLITNLISILIGAGIGIWLSKRGGNVNEKMFVKIIN